LVACLDELQAADALTGIRLVATSSQWHSAMATHPDGRAASPVLTWLDTRAGIGDRRPDDPAAYHRRTGAFVHPLYWSAKVPFLRASLPGSRDLRFAGLTEYLRQRLLGDDAISLSMASGTGMLDTVTGRWDPEALAIAGVTHGQLPEVDDRASRLTAELARRWPGLAGADWMPALGDGASSTIGAGAFDGPTVGVTVGTSAAARVVSELPLASATDPGADTRPDLHPGLWRYRVDDGRILTGAAVSGGGVLYGWLKSLLGEVREPSLPPGIASAGVAVTPMHAGSRPPEVVPGGSGVVSGLGLTTSPEQLVAATYEGVALELLRSVELLDTTFGERLPVVLGGGAVAASPWWRRAIAAAFDRPVRYQTHAEVGARGAAALALGIHVPPPQEDVPVEPHATEAMRDARVRFDRARGWVTPARE
jgi:gluconokinase